MERRFNSTSILGVVDHLLMLAHLVVNITNLYSSQPNSIHPVQKSCTKVHDIWNISGPRRYSRYNFPFIVGQEITKRIFMYYSACKGLNVIHRPKCHQSL